MSGEMDKPLISRLLLESDGSLAEVPSEAFKVGILGSGDFARSLATRLVGSGFSVVVGSRNPKRTAGLFPSAAQVTFQEEAVCSPNVIFVAVFREHYPSLCGLSDGLAGRVLVDVSNPTAPELLRHRQSNAEYLASLFPTCAVVKAFNVISAWTLQAGPRDGNRQVPICADQPEAKRMVSELARAMGFTPVDMGSLASAREVEAMPLRLLPGWKVPALLALGLFVCFFAYNFVRDVLQPYVQEGKNKFYKLPVSVVNTTLPCVAYVLLSLVYLPGVLAAAVQLRRGTKYRRFPDWLDHWLQHRKQIGLLSFFCAALHVLYSFCLPLRRSHRYDLVNLAVKQVLANKSHLWIEEEVWRMEIYLSLGVLALGTLSLLAVTSLPSIANALSWREFSFVQVPYTHGLISPQLKTQGEPLQIVRVPSLCRILCSPRPCPVSSAGSTQPLRLHCEPSPPGCQRRLLNPWLPPGSTWISPPGCVAWKLSRGSELAQADTTLLVSLSRGPLPCST
ncbi:metalloreductase STEAP3 isoform X4 [Dasypus novemcinctus]